MRWTTYNRIMDELVAADRVADERLIMLAVRFGLAWDETRPRRPIARRTEQLRAARAEQAARTRNSRIAVRPIAQNSQLGCSENPRAAGLEICKEIKGCKFPFPQAQLHEEAV
jgi:hypothetical protein